MLDKHLIAKVRPVAISHNTVLWKNIRVSVLGERLFRIEKSEKGIFCDKATQCVWFRDMPAVDFSVAENKKYIEISTGSARICVYEDVMQSVAFVDGKKVKLADVENLPGAYRSLDGCDGEIYVKDKAPIKLEDGIVSASGVGIHNDSDSLILDEDGKLYLREHEELDLYVFAHGNDYRGALCNLFMISGEVPMIPRYALGNWWSRYHAYTEAEYLHILDKLADRDIPLTVATIDMDWHWSKTLDQSKQISAQGKNDDYHGGNNGWTGYSWNTDLFPDYKKFLQKIKDRNLKITLNLHPADGVRYFEDMYAEMAEALGLDPKTEKAIPFDFTSDEFINAYFKILHKPYEHDGVEFWWMDWQQGTQTATPGLDPLWALNHYHTLDNALEHAPLLLSRYCKIGSHRYPLGFSGDTYTTWNSLEYIPYFTAMGTNAGYTWWSHDIGGHTWGIKDDEMYARYVQFGVFSPIMRLHCVSFPTITKEPSVYMGGSGFIAEEFMRLRHRMIPYLYSAGYETNKYGKALIEPMYYAYPDKKDAYKCPGQYLFGGDLIVAPITKKSDSKGLCAKKIWLPEGLWTDIFTGDEYNGGRWVEVVRWEDTIPVLAKDGSFFVLDGRKHTNSIENPDKLSVAVFNGNGEYTLHEDKNGSYMHTSFKSSLEGNRQTVSISASGDTSVVAKREYRLEFRNVTEGKARVYAGGKEICFDTDLGDYLTVIIPQVDSSLEYTVEVDFERNALNYRNARLLYALVRIEAVNKLKYDAYVRLKNLDDDAVIADVNSIPEFTKNEKKRLLEMFR